MEAVGMCADKPIDFPSVFWASQKIGRAWTGPILFNVSHNDRNQLNANAK